MSASDGGAAPEIRKGWAHAAMRIAEAGDDVLAMGEFANTDDEKLEW